MAELKQYQVTLCLTLHVAPEVIERGLSKEFSEDFYRFDSKEEVAEHLAFNLVQGRELSSLEGWADMRDGQARVTDIDVFEAEELPE